MIRKPVRRDAKKRFQNQPGWQITLISSGRGKRMEYSGRKFCCKVWPALLWTVIQAGAMVGGPCVGGVAT
jgi:hypothetical protein